MRGLRGTLLVVVMVLASCAGVHGQVPSGQYVTLFTPQTVYVPQTYQVRNEFELRQTWLFPRLYRSYRRVIYTPVVPVVVQPGSSVPAPAK